ncbi:protein involved in biosynthesis of mitomycin antibiotics/polyketide fumonisin [Paenibacillus baekrokdamisoli]|uniref:Protein involved in biosynthesis of mitomycin antibiotics/polyketide fumonisin n=1 Tax=Paenibacillus baekrokdamisoli TaxID=1712516 RepID=A0A3G9J6W3_9BACL|nr:phytanoyl-CoA dioxygenase family protein [Paenibacillus baekrokdamisoli]MBB3067743.1 ectoine hydroxylase-related dioxygenase (phytanoyl-CoA dioxygenase family) [Paenibacillus baekrokdamisoli]BBH19074.1 protein involved in biosynthesis of mitomycin antibiotics/polyketide fumonisin [Paenibacillus baekrokdamisoli]
MTAIMRVLTAEQKQQFDQEGYLVVKGLFSTPNLAEIEQTFEEISHQTIPDHFEPDLDQTSNDPLKRYPRVMHPHRFNEAAKRYMLHPPVLDVLADLYEEEALAAQSMFYYKPPGSRGQALHQDNFYLKVEPGNCIAAWTAVDAATEENGGLLIVPRTHEYEISCPDEADTKESFTTHYVKPPKDSTIMPVIMDKGDVLFFNGNLIHGSYRNKTKDQFRRAFICHYANSSATSIGQHYKPLYRADGSEAHEMESNPDGGPCGVEVDGYYH